jgi:kinesin family protein 6/9
MNQASTRSHCIFTIHITARETGSATIRKAKLHLVDLAGFVIEISISLTLKI